MSQASRRAFLQQAAALSSLGAASPLGLSLLTMNEAAAQSGPTDYKALVCIFLYGGNDAYNTVVGHRHRFVDALCEPPRSGLSQRHRHQHLIALLAPGTTPNGTAAVGSPARFGGCCPSTTLAARYTGRQLPSIPH